MKVGPIRFTCLDDSNAKSKVNGAKLLNSYILSFGSRGKKDMACFKQGFLSSSAPLRCFHLCLCWIWLFWLLWSFFTKNWTRGSVGLLFQFSVWQPPSFPPLSMFYTETVAGCARTRNKTVALHKLVVKTPLNPLPSSQGGDRRDVSVGRLLLRMQATI